METLYNKIYVEENQPIKTKLKHQKKKKKKNPSKPELPESTQENHPPFLYSKMLVGIPYLNLKTYPYIDFKSLKSVLAFSHNPSCIDLPTNVV